MDGNGRWAEQRGLPRTMGHRQGIEAARCAVKAAANLGVSYLTLFGFSTENWARPADEISDLMGLLRYYLRAEAADLHKNNVRLRVIGRRDRLDPDIVELIEAIEANSTNNKGLTLTIALDYGGRQDILQAVKTLVAQGVDADAITETHFESALQTAGMPAPDVLIRTSGEQRISNFLLWPCAYTEFVFSPVLWPDFSEETMRAALTEYASRKRRFGALDPVTDDQAAHAGLQTSL